MSKARTLADLVAAGSPLVDGTIETSDITNVTASPTELNYTDGVTSNIQTQLNTKVETLSDLSITATATELNYMDGVTSAVQTQLDNISVTSGTLTKSFADGESATITLSSSVSPTALVAVTKEINQTGASSKGAWDVNATASNYELYNEAPATSLSLSSTSADGTATLGTGSFSSSDVGKRIFVDDGGEAILTATDGSYVLVSDFGASTYTSGNWSLSGLDADADDGITLSQLNTGWDVSDATYSQSLSVSAQGTNPQSVFFKPDGTRMYVVGYTSDDVDEYDLSTAWDVSTATHSRGFNVAAQETTPNALFFKPDGTKMYVLGQQGDDVNEYSLSTAWNVTTASISATGSVAAQETTPYGLFFRDDGTKMYVSGQSGEDVNEYNLSTAWDVSTLVFVQNKSVSSETSYPQAVSFKADGTKMFILGQVEDAVFEYDLSTAWNVTTAVYSKTFSVASQATDPTGMFFKPDGTELYVVDQGNDTVYQYNVGALYQPTAQYFPAITSASGQIDSTYWTDINSMTADDVDGDGQVYYAVSTDDRTTWSIAKASDGVRDIVRDNGGTWQYNSAVDGWALENAAYVQAFNVSSQDTIPNDVFFKPDGTKMYVVGDAGNDVNEYNLSTAWDISTATYSQIFSVGSQDSQPTGIFFKTDGTKMYLVGETNDSAYEYDLSTAWDISTATINNTLSVSAQSAAPSAIHFKPDGLKMYIAGFSNQDEVNEYNLSTAWDISTATFSQVFSFASQDNTTYSFFFKSDGTKMYALGAQFDKVYEYDLSTAWDISTATFSQDFYIGGQEVVPRGLFFKTDGTKLYIVGSDSDAVHEYNSAGYTTSETWVNATTNDEFAAVAQAMSIGPNQMDKAQIDAVTDGSHFTLGTTLDLAIIPYLGSAGTAPTSDGVSINYDAAVLNKGAILGTDYDYDIPANDKVRITALAATNLKVRVV